MLLNVHFSFLQVQEEGELAEDEASLLLTRQTYEGHLFVPL